MITAQQIRASRALLGWHASLLAEKAKMSSATLSNIENEIAQGKPDSLKRLFNVLSDAGIELIGDDGVRLKNEQVTTLNGENIFFRVLEDVIATLKNAEDAEALFACVDDKMSPPVVIENYKRLRKAGIKMRSLVQEGNSYLMGELEEYRYIPTEFFHNSTTVIYGNKFATMILDPETKEDVGAIIIRNPHVSAAQRNLFNYIWSLGQKPKKSNAKVKYD